MVGSEILHTAWPWELGDDPHGVRKLSARRVWLRRIKARLRPAKRARRARSWSVHGRPVQGPRRQPLRRRFTWRCASFSSTSHPVVSACLPAVPTAPHGLRCTSCRRAVTSPVPDAMCAARSTSQRACARACACAILGCCMVRSSGPAWTGASPSCAS